MDRFSPKLEIINHFDNMINRVDIEIEECLLKCNQDQILGDLERIAKIFKIPLCFHLSFFPSSSEKNTNQSVEMWPKSTKVIDYLNQVRKSTIDELRQAQKGSIDHFNSISSLFKLHDQEKRLDQIKSQLFGEKFYFQVCYKPKKEMENLIFKLYTIVTDFYMSPDDIDLLEKMINASDDIYLLDSYSDIIFDEKMVLIGLINECFFENLNNTQESPNHLIRVSRSHLLNVRSISCHYAMSGVNLMYSPIYLPLKLEKLALRGKRELVEVKIEEFSLLKSLDLKLISIERITLRNLTVLQDLKLDLIESPINSNLGLFDQLPTVKKLTLIGLFSNFSLDSIFHLEELSLTDLLNDDFNFDLFKSCCNQLTDLSIDCFNIDQKILNRLFIDHRFPNLSKLRIANTLITKLETKIFNRFQTLTDLTLHNNKELKFIGYAFSNLQRLTRLNLTGSCINSLSKRHFSKLTNLEYLKLSVLEIVSLKENVFSDLKKLKTLELISCKKVKDFKPKSFMGLENLKILDLRGNYLTRFDLRILKNLPQVKMVNLSASKIVNKEEVLNHMKAYSNIEFIFSTFY